MELRRQREELTAVTPRTEPELGDLKREFELRITFLHQRAREIDEAIHATNARLGTLLHDPHPAVSQTPAHMGPKASFPALSVATSAATLAVM